MEIKRGVKRVDDDLGNLVIVPSFSAKAVLNRNRLAKLVHRNASAVKGRHAGHNITIHAIEAYASAIAVRP